MSEWINVNSVSTYVGPHATKRLKHPGRATESEKRIVSFKTNKGETKQRAIYDKAYTSRTTDAKFARVARMLASWEYMTETLTNELKRTDRLTPTRVVACALLVMLHTGMRPSSDEGGETGGEPTYGCLSLTAQHITLGKNGRVDFNFRGKKGVEYKTTLTDRTIHQCLAQLIHQSDSGMFNIAGIGVFATAIQDEVSVCTPTDLTKRLRKFHKSFNLKDIRTGKAMLTASVELSKIKNAQRQHWYTYLPQKKGELKKLAKQLCKDVCDRVSTQLNNLPTTTKAKYINPTFWEAMLLAVGYSAEDAKCLNPTRRKGKR